MKVHEPGGRHPTHNTTLCDRPYVDGDRILVAGETSDGEVDCRICLSRLERGVRPEGSSPKGSSSRRPSDAPKLTLIKGGLYETG